MRSFSSQLPTKQALVVNTQAFRLASVSSVRLLGIRKSFRLENFQARACSRVYKRSHLRVFQACDCCTCTSLLPSQEFKDCVCCKFTGLPVLRCYRLALVVTPSFRVSDSTHLEKSRKTSFRENVSGRPWMARSHVLPTPLVGLEMLSGSQKRATLCTSFVSVIIVFHCFTGCSCLTVLCGVVNKCQFCVLLE